MKLKILMVLIGVLIFSSCITMTIEQTVHEDLSSDLSVVYDMSALLQMAQGFSNSTNSSEEETEDLCEDFNEGALEGYSCTSTDEGIITISGKYSFVGIIEVEETFMQKKYTYDAMNVFNVVNGMSDDEEQDLTKESLSEMRALNPTFEYEITLPGVIESTQVGTIQGENTVVIDLFELENKETAVIVAVQKKDFVTPIVIGVGIILLIVILVILVMKKKKNPQKEESNDSKQEESQDLSEETPLEEELSKSMQAMKTYIETYKDKYSKEQLQSAMIKQNYKEEEIEKALESYYK